MLDFTPRGYLEKKKVHAVINIFFCLFILMKCLFYVCICVFLRIILKNVYNLSFAICEFPFDFQLLKTGRDIRVMTLSVEFRFFFISFSKYPRTERMIPLFPCVFSSSFRHVFVLSSKNILYMYLQ